MEQSPSSEANSFLFIQNCTYFVELGHNHVHSSPPLVSLLGHIDIILGHIDSPWDISIWSLGHIATVLGHIHTPWGTSIVPGTPIVLSHIHGP